MTRIFLLFLVLPWVILEPAHAQILISSITEDTSGDGTVTISGSGFGVGDTTPILWDDFESGVDGTILSSTPKLGEWRLGSSPTPVYSTTHSHSGTKSAYSGYSSPSSQWSSFVVNPLPIADKFYQSFWFRYDTQGTLGQLKLMQVHGDCGCGDFAPGIMSGSSTTAWWFSYISVESGSSDNASQTNYPLIPDSGISQNVWHHFEMTLERSSAGGLADGNVNIFIDSVNVFNKTNVITRESSANNWNEISFFHGVTNMDGDTNVYIDEAYLNDSWSRVIIGNNSQFEDITHGEIQRVTSWSDTGTTVKINKGSFHSLGGKYLYVIDADGNVNSQGFPVAPEIPLPPINMRVD